MTSSKKQAIKLHELSVDLEKKTKKICIDGINQIHIGGIGKKKNAVGHYEFPLSSFAQGIDAAKSKVCTTSINWQKKINKRKLQSHRA